MDICPEQKNRLIPEGDVQEVKINHEPTRTTTKYVQKIRGVRMVRGRIFLFGHFYFKTSYIIFEKSI